MSSSASSRLVAFARAFFAPLVLAVLLLVKRLVDERNKLKRTFPFLQNEELRIALHPRAVPSLDFLRQLHAAQKSNLAGFFPAAPYPAVVEFSLQSPLLTRLIFERVNTGSSALELKPVHDAAIEHALHQTRNWHRAAMLSDVAFACEQALLPIAVQVAANKNLRASKVLPPQTEDEDLVMRQIWQQSTNLVTCALRCFGKHREYAEEVERELDNKIGRRVPPALRELDASFLPKFDRFLLESARLESALDVLMLDVDRHLEVGDYVVPKRAKLYLPLRLAHRNEEFFHDADRFDPNRFQDRILERENLVSTTFEDVDLVSQTIARAFLASVLQRFTVTAAAADGGQQESFNLTFTKRETGRTL